MPIKFTKLATDALNDRYLHRDAQGNITETPEEMFRRVAKHAASAEPCESDRKFFEELFYQAMANLDFLPNSPTLMNAGRPAPHGQLAACFVIGIEDDMNSITKALTKQMLIHKTGGGTGFNFSKLRPANATVNSTNGRASGPVSFMRLFDLSTEIIQQGGMRRGANMAILNADHPDIEQFISCKDKEGVITNFNLSVGITDDFMRRATTQPFSREAHILEEIAAHAWKTGDPGVVFIDALNRDNPCPEYGPIEATNPCGESPLLADEACNLGSINLGHYVKNGRIDFDRLKGTVNLAVRFLDDIITVGQYPLPEIEAAVKRTRKIGLGIMGWADMLYQLHIPYDTKEARDTARQIMAVIDASAKGESYRLADIKGSYNGDRQKPRNATRTCIAPTGTLAILADASSGIEPMFSNYHTRKMTTQSGETKEYTVFNKHYEQLIADPKITDDEIAQICKTAYTVAPLDHIRMQAAFQQQTDLA
ncbi:MAG: adenosylcobalamin-dependent ribonucleoside-diphosphate reductase, partial [Cloacibacillus sp.]